MILASALKVDEIALKKSEAEELAKAMAEVAKHYPHAISPVTIAWVNLATCAGLIYVPRVYLVAKKSERKKPAPAAPRPMPQPAPGPGPQSETAAPVPETGRVFVMPILGSIPGESGAGM